MAGLGVGASIVGLMILGTAASLFSKIVYGLHGKGKTDSSHPAVHAFEKPWFMVLVMFSGMSWCLVIDLLRKRGRKPMSPDDENLQERLLGEHPVQQSKWRLVVLCLPTIADLTATVLMNIGLLHTTVSVYQMMRGAELVFAAIFAIVFLRRRLNYLHFTGILLCISGILLVGLSSILGSSKDQPSAAAPSRASNLLGMGLIIASQAVQAGQLTFEDYFMADLDFEPLQIVGWEGVFGAGIMVGVVLPAAYFLPGGDVGGRMENTADTGAMAASSPVLLGVLLTHMCVLLCYNYVGMCLTGHVGAVFRTVLETVRTLFVWLIDVGLFYLTSTGFGEEITENSWVQGVGFVVLVCGTLVYGQGDELTATRVAEEEALLIDPITSPPAGGSPTGPVPLPPPLGSIAHTPPTAPVSFSPSSFKSTMNIAISSRPGSLSGSGSLPRAGGGSLQRSGSPRPFGLGALAAGGGGSSQGGSAGGGGGNLSRAAGSGGDRGSDGI